MKKNRTKRTNRGVIQPPCCSAVSLPPIPGWLSLRVSMPSMQRAQLWFNYPHMRVTGDGNHSTKSRAEQREQRPESRSNLVMQVITSRSSSSVESSAALFTL